MPTDLPSTLRHLVELTRSTLPPMHPAGRPFVLGSAAAALLLGRRAPVAGTVGALAAVCCAAFFRDPPRTPPEPVDRLDLALAPADGTVSSVEPAAAPAELGLDDTLRPRVSAFLSIFDVHVQRAPCDGEVVAAAYRPGAFLTADLDKASEDNERNSLLLRDTRGRELVVVQIAGLVARRIVCSVAAGDAVAAGSTYGLIRFGSRVDLYLPPGSTVLARTGQRTIGGETVLARLPGARLPGAQLPAGA